MMKIECQDLQENDMLLYADYELLWKGAKGVRKEMRTSTHKEG
jgi:hypothetical protein